MRIRTVKPEFFTDEKVRSLPYETRLLFIGLWCFADDAGRFESDTALIKALIFPSDDVDVAAKLRELHRKKLIKSYRVAKKSYFLIPSWHRHQRINRPSEPRTPPPIRRQRHTKDTGSRARGALTEPSSRLKRKGREGKGRESVCQSNHTTTDNQGSSSSAGTDGQTDGSLLKALEPFFPRARIDSLARDFPPERLLWAAQRTKDASGARRVKRPASYFLRIVADDGQWERYLCDQYALGKAGALQKQRELTAQRARARKELERRKQIQEEAALGKYLKTIPAQVKESLTNHAVDTWAKENNIDVEEHKKKGWWLHQIPIGLYRTHVRRAWLALGKPGMYVPGHLRLPDNPKAPGFNPGNTERSES